MVGWLIGGDLSTTKLFLSSCTRHEMAQAEAKQDMISFISIAKYPFIYLYFEDTKPILQNYLLIKFTLKIYKCKLHESVNIS